MKVIYLILTVIVFFQINSFASYIRNFPVTVYQPNGEQIDCFVSGDEYHNWYHDENDYTIIQHPQTGYYVYAISENNEIVASNYIVGEYDPQKLSLEKGVNISENTHQEKRDEFYRKYDEYFHYAPKTGTFNNLVVFIRFSDESEFTDNISYYDELFNSSSINANSLYNYFSEVSYDQLFITSHFYPSTGSTYVISYQDAHQRSYYQPFHLLSNPNGYITEAQRTSREHNLLKNAIQYIANEVPSSVNIDSNNDGLVDNVVFVVSGSPDGWSELLWPHRWVLYSESAYIHNKRVWDYNFQLRDFLDWSGNGVLCHEMFHTLGAPDLYHYSQDGLSPAGIWDLMASTTNPPQHMTAYMKYRYGEWIENIPEIISGGEYTLNPLVSSESNCYKIISPNSQIEYFILEYRKKEGIFESSLPGSGIIIYRINTNKDGEGNRNGPPDELYVYRPNGGATNNGDIAEAYFSSDVGRTEFNSSSNPSCFLSNGNDGAIDISNIGSAQSIISFYVNMTGDLVIWPGDANNDGIVGVPDVLPIGLFYGYTGPARNNGGCTWGARTVAEGWIPEEAAYADCNGDGIVDVADVLCIGINYGKTHGIMQKQIAKMEEGTDSYLWLQYYNKKGEPMNLSSIKSADEFYVAVNSSSINDAVGLSFNIKYDRGLIELSDEDQVLGKSFAEDALHLVKQVKQENTIEVGLSNLRGEVIEDEGELLRFKVVKKYKGAIAIGIEEIVGMKKDGSYFRIKAEENEVANGEKGEPITGYSVVNYPNPFNPSTIIEFRIPERSIVSLKIYNMIGEEVSEIIGGKELESGIYKYSWDASKLSSGIYIYRLIAEKETIAKKMLLVK